MPQVELTAMVDQLVNLKQQLQSLNTVAGNFKKQLQDVGSQGYRRLTTESQILNNKLRKELSIIQQLIILRQKAKKSVNTSEDIRQLKAIEKKVKELDKERIAVKKLDAELKKNASVNKQVVNTNNKVAASQNRVSKSTQKSNMMFRQLRGVMLSTFGAYAIIRGIKDTVKTFAEFEFEMAKVSAVLGATTEEIKMLSEAALKVSGNGIFSPKELSTLELKLAKLGYSINEITVSLEPIAQLATATGEALESTATLVASTIRGMGYAASETQRVVDVMAASFTSSGLDVAKFRESIKYIAPVARRVGIEIEGVASVLAKLADAQLYGSLAGTGLRNIFLASADAAGKLSKRVGFTVKSLDDFIKAFEILNEQGADMTEFLDMFAKRSVTAALIIADNTEELRLFREEMNEVTGAGEKMAEVIKKTLKGQTIQVTNAWKAMWIQIGLDQEGGLTNMVGSFGGLLKGWTLVIKHTDKTLAELIIDPINYLRLYKDAYAKEQIEIEETNKKTQELTKEEKNLLEEKKTALEEYRKTLTNFTREQFDDEKKRITNLLISKKKESNINSKTIADFKLAKKEGRETAIADIGYIEYKNQELKKELGYLEDIKVALREQKEFTFPVVSINTLKEELTALKELRDSIDIGTEKGLKQKVVLLKEIAVLEARIRKEEGKAAKKDSALKEEIKNNKDLLKSKYELAKSELELIKDTKEKETKLSELERDLTIAILDEEKKLLKGNVTALKGILIDKEAAHQNHANNLLEINGNSIDAVIEAEDLKNDILKSKLEKNLAEKKAQWEKDGNTEVEIRRKTAIGKAKLDQEMLDAEVAVAQMELRLRSDGTNATAEEIEQLQLKVDNLIIRLEAAGVKVKMLEARPAELTGWKKFVEDLDENAEKFLPTMGSIVDAYGSIADAAVDKSERIVDALNTQVSEQQSALEIEMRLAEQGLANNVNVRKQELADAKKARDQSLKDREKALKKQEYIESISQSINLATTASTLLKDYVGKIPIFGLGLGIVAIAALLQAFKGFKADSSALTKYERGGWEILQGKSHTNGGIPLGNGREAQGGEMMSIFNRNATKKHQPLISGLTDAINKDKLDVFLNQGAFGKVNDSNINVSQSVNLDDSKQIDKMNNLLYKNLKQRNIRFEGNKRIEKFGSRTRIIIMS